MGRLPICESFCKGRPYRNLTLEAGVREVRKAGVGSGSTVSTPQKSPQAAVIFRGDPSTYKNYNMTAVYLVFLFLDSPFTPMSPLSQ